MRELKKYCVTLEEGAESPPLSCQPPLMFYSMQVDDKVWCLGENGRLPVTTTDDAGNVGDGDTCRKGEGERVGDTATGEKDPVDPDDPVDMTVDGELVRQISETHLSEDTELIYDQDNDDEKIAVPSEEGTKRSEEGNGVENILNDEKQDGIAVGENGEKEEEESISHTSERRASTEGAPPTTAEKEMEEDIKTTVNLRETEKSHGTSGSKRKSKACVCL